MSTIGDLCVVSSVSPDDKLPIWSNANGVTRAVPISVFDSRYITQQDITGLAASPSTERFIAGIDFTPGSTLAISLANQYISTSNIEVFFDALFQGPDQYTLVGTTLAFTSPIPLGVQNVYVKGGSIRITGAPSDGTVNDAKIASGSAIYNRIFDPINPKDPQFGARGNTVLDASGAFVSGVDDTTAIQAAVGFAAMRGGGRVELTNGVFCISGAIQIPDNVEIVCKGSKIFYKKPLANYLHCIILQGKNTAARDLHIVCDPALVRDDTGFGICANGATNALIENCTLENIASAAIWVTNSVNTRVIGNRISNTKADGIHFSDNSIGFVAVGNILNGTQDDALAAVLDTVGAVQPQNGLIAGNTVNGTTRGHGVVFISAVNLTIEANTLVAIGASSGIGCYQWNADTRKASNVTIVGNFISQVGLTVGSFIPLNALSVHGILLGFCDNVTVIGNTISDINDNLGYVSAGIFLYAYRSAVIKSNVIKNCISHGVWVYDATPSATADLTDLYIEDNTFINVEKYAIRANPTTAFLSGVFIKGNTYKDCAYDASVAGVVVSAGRTQTTPLRYYGNMLLNRETSTVTLDATNASDIRKANNIPSF